MARAGSMPEGKERGDSNQLVGGASSTPWK